MGWLEDFVEHTRFGEAPPKIMYWVGVSAIAGALRRKVWIDEFNFQWTPNFYILLVGPPGVLKKSTSSGLGMRLLAKLEDIDFGPQAVTWEQLVSHMAASTQQYKIGDKEFEASCVTIELSEFGTLFDPANRQMVDNLTDMWDAKLHTFRKETKTNGCDEVVNPWLNIIAGVSDGWLDDNFSGKYIKSGFASRVIFVRCTAEEVGRISHPSRLMHRDMHERENSLVTRLMEIATYAGPYKLTEAAYLWSDNWYNGFRDWLEKECPPADIGLYSRRQTHLMKLAMVISASKGKFPVIDVDELVEADQALTLLAGDTQAIFGNVGQTNISKLAKDVVETLRMKGSMTKKELYRRHFFRRVGVKDFEDALESAKGAGLVKEVSGAVDSMLKVVG